MLPPDRILEDHRGHRDAFGVCVYLVSKDTTTHERDSTLAFSKVRVRPLKFGKAITDAQMSICRLELLAASILIRAVRYVRKSLMDGEALRVRYFSDSQVTLHRIHADFRRYQIFTANRIKHIQEFSSPDDWYYVATKLNPADAASRGCLLTELYENDLWSRGPAFIRDETHDYDEQKVQNIVLSRELQHIESQETKKVVSPFLDGNFHHTLMCVEPESVESPTVQLITHNTEAVGAPTTATNHQPSNQVKFITDIAFFLDEEHGLLNRHKAFLVDEDDGLLSNIHSWRRLLNILSRVLRVVRHLTRRVEAFRERKQREALGLPVQNLPKKPARNLGFLKLVAEGRRPIPAAELATTELFVFRIAQALSWPEEVKKLAGGEPLLDESQQAKLAKKKARTGGH